MKFVIYSHYKRSHFAEALLKHLPRGSEIFTDPGTGQAYAIKSCLDKFKATSTDYLVLLEDDIRLCSNFERSVNNVLLANRDSRVITFFSVSNEVLEAKEKGCQFIKSKTLSWMQCVAYPVSKIDKILEYLKPGVKWFEDVLSAYCYNENDFMLQPLPNFVQHLELPSICGNPIRIGGKPRTSKLWGTGENIDYSQTYFNPLQSKVQHPQSEFETIIKWHNEDLFIIFRI